MAIHTKHQNAYLMTYHKYVSPGYTIFKVDESKVHCQVAEGIQKLAFRFELKQPVVFGSPDPVGDLLPPGWDEILSKHLKNVGQILVIDSDNIYEVIVGNFVRVADSVTRFKYFDQEEGRLVDIYRQEPSGFPLYINLNSLENLKNDLAKCFDGISTRLMFYYRGRCEKSSRLMRCACTFGTVYDSSGNRHIQVKENPGVDVYVDKGIPFHKCPADKISYSGKCHDSRSTVETVEAIESMQVLSINGAEKFTTLKLIDGGWINANNMLKTRVDSELYSNLTECKKMGKVFRVDDAKCVSIYNMLRISVANNQNTVRNGYLLTNSEGAVQHENVYNCKIDQIIVENKCIPKSKFIERSFIELEAVEIIHNGTFNKFWMVSKTSNEMTMFYQQGSVYDTKCQFGSIFSSSIKPGLCFSIPKNYVKYIHRLVLVDDHLQTQWLSKCNFF